MYLMNKTKTVSCWECFQQHHPFSAWKNPVNPPVSKNHVKKGLYFEGICLWVCVFCLCVMCNMWHVTTPQVHISLWLMEKMSYNSLYQQNDTLLWYVLLAKIIPSCWLSHFQYLDKKNIIFYVTLFIEVHFVEEKKAFCRITLLSSRKTRNSPYNICFSAKTNFYRSVIV